MIGDKIKIKPYHKRGAQLVLVEINKLKLKPPFSIVVAGESGSGKSEIAQCLKDFLTEIDLKVIVLGQDDYFKLPPHSNHRKRQSDIDWVGSNEVKLELLENHVAALLDPKGMKITKPLVNFEKDSIGSESITGPFDVVIAEGTYTSLLKNITLKAFINRDYQETKKDRLSRNRDQALDGGKDQALTFLETVLKIEHQIISKHKAKANVIIPPPKDLLNT